jgi:protein-S-isoprenylcysteine O-methyltransferase Ste14
MVAGFAYPPTLLPFFVGYAALGALVAGVEAALASPNERAPETSSPTGLFSQASGLLFMALWLGSPFFASGGPLVWRALIGAVAIGSGLALRATAIVTLGARFNSDNYIEAGAVLETKGLYRRLAHPSELGLLLLAVGALAYWAAAILWIIAPLYLVTVARLNLEETALTRSHGARYVHYRRHTLDPFPFLAPQGGSRA